MNTTIRLATLSMGTFFGAWFWLGLIFYFLGGYQTEGALLWAVLFPAITWYITSRRTVYLEEPGYLSSSILGFVLGVLIALSLGDD